MSVVASERAYACENEDCYGGRIYLSRTRWSGDRHQVVDEADFECPDCIHGEAICQTCENDGRPKVQAVARLPFAGLVCAECRDEAGEHATAKAQRGACDQSPGSRPPLPPAA